MGEIAFLNFGGCIEPNPYIRSKVEISLNSVASSEYMNFKGQENSKANCQIFISSHLPKGKKRGKFRSFLEDMKILKLGFEFSLTN